MPDYQGSIIGVVDTSTGYPEQVTNYYPYGTPHASGMGEAVNRRAFGGKEYTREFGVHSLDFGARPYSPLTGSFLQPDPLAGNLTAISPYAYCAGDPVNLTDPTGMRPDEPEGACMCDYTYGDGPVKLIGGWREAPNDYGLELDNEDNGFKSKLFVREKDGKKEYAYVFAGTQFTSMKDWIQNVLQLVGLSDQYELAMKNADKLAQRIKVELTFLGHSLGGGLAAASAYATGGQAMTYNAAGVSPLTVRFNPDARIYAYVTYRDELNFFQRTHHLPHADGIIHYRKARASLLGHSIKNFYAPSIMSEIQDFVMRGMKKIEDSINPKNLMFP